MEESPRAVPKLDGLIVGELAGVSEAGQPLVQFEGNVSGHPVPARIAGPIDPGDVGQPVGLIFEGGDPARPIAIGVLRDQWPEVSSSRDSAHSPGSGKCALCADGERVELRAAREIVLQVGKASITLTRSGKVLIRGAYLLSRSSGVNRIKGGSIQLN